MLRHLIYYKNLTKYFNFIDAFFITFCLKFRFSKLFLPILKRTILLRKNTKDKETFKEIFFSNIYNTELPFEPKKIIDAGSNIGLASFFFRIKYPKSKIVAFEIETENYNKAFLLRLTTFFVHSIFLLSYLRTNPNKAYYFMPN